MKNPNNKLSLEKSPYLKQHKDNPVNWYPWGEEAFAKARNEKKPIFLSIGYSSCHWCHVMEKECFEDSDVAEVLNEKFVSIKVDREERPDVDSLYMLVCQMMTGQGGWPLTIFMNANKDPFFAGTYFPKLTQSNRLGFLDLLKRIDFVWHKETKELHSTIQNIRGALQESQKISAGPSGLTPQQLVEKATEELKAAFDPKRGGFSHSPKFPSPHKLLFLMGQSKDKESRQMVETTLREMQRGGVFDHARGGFHRYSTDQNWELPHFEKMLYDQALCATAYLEAFQMTGHELYKYTAEKTLQYVLNDLCSPDGAFYAAYDADSEGEEGSYYIWTLTELKSLLNESEFKKLSVFFDLKEDGNYLDEATHEKTGKNILFLKDALTPAAFENYKELEPIFEKIKKAASQRPAPLLDTKILLDWNALFSVALLKAYEVLGDKKYFLAAKKNLDFIQNKMCSDKELFHRYCDGEALKIGFLDDYAAYIQLLLQFYKLTQEDDYLVMADDFYQEVVRKHYDAVSGSFYLSSTNELSVKTKDFYDGAYPCGNSIMINNTVLLWQYTEQKKFEKILNSFFEKNATTIAISAMSSAYLMKALREWNEGAIEIQILGDWDKNQQTEIESILRDYYLPRKFLKNMSGDTPQIQICRNQTCSLPVSTMEAFKNLLNALN